MSFNANLRSYTTGFLSNCAFHCLTHHLASDLEKRPLNELSKLYSENGYKVFLNEFKEFYKLPSSPTVPFLQHILKAFPNPIDREAIFGSVLRNTFISVMKLEKKAEDFYQSFTADVREYLNGKKGFSSPYAILANEEWLNQFRKEYLSASTLNAIYNGGTPLTVEMFLKNENGKKGSPIYDYWMKEGFNKYITYLANSKNGATISAEELSWLTNALGIDLHVFADERSGSCMRFLSTKSSGTKALILLNTGRHWEYESVDEPSAKGHNKAYSIIPTLKALMNEAAPALHEIQALSTATGATFSDLLLRLDISEQNVLFGKIKSEISKLHSTYSNSPDPLSYDARLPGIDKVGQGGVYLYDEALKLAIEESLETQQQHLKAKGSPSAAPVISSGLEIKEHHERSQLPPSPSEQGLTKLYSVAYVDGLEAQTRYLQRQAASDARLIETQRKQAEYDAREIEALKRELAALKAKQVPAFTPHFTSQPIGSSVYYPASQLPGRFNAS